MPRTFSTDWSVDDDIAALRLQDFNLEIDDLFMYGTDRGRIREAISGTPLRIDIGEFAWRVGSVSGQFAGDTDVVVTNNQTNYVEIDSTGTIQINTTGWLTANARLGIVVCSGGAITSISLWKPDVIGGTLGTSILVNVQTLSGNLTLDATDEYYQQLNPNGSNRTVELDTGTQSEGGTFYIKNTGTAGNLNVTDDVPNALITIPPGRWAVFVYDGSAWAVQVYPVDERYGDGSDGALNVTSGTTQIDCNNESLVVRQYTSFNVSAGATLEFINVPDAGIVFMPLVQGNYTMAGTIDMDGDGGRGGLINTASRNGNSGGTTLTGGNAANDGWNNQGQPRGGRGGNTQQSSNNRNVSGGASGAAPFRAGTASAAVTSGGTAAAATAGEMISTAVLAALANHMGITLHPGLGGGSGAICLSLNNITGGSGTYTYTAPEGGRGGGSMLAVVGGSFSQTGTVNQRGSSPSNSSGSNGSYTGSNAGFNMLAAGSGAGSGGAFIGLVKRGQSITNSATYNQGGGTGGTGTGSSGGSGSGTGSGTYGNGANGVSGMNFVGYMM